jgi:AraC-like DNA-binding protein
VYAERGCRVPGAVLWTRTLADWTPARILPDGCQDLMWLGGELVVAGPDTRPHLSGGPPGARYVGLRFAPGTAPAVFGVPAHELRDRRLPLDALWPAAVVRRLAERVADAADPGAVLESIATDRLARADPPDPGLAEIVARLRAGDPVAAVADAVGLSSRQLHRRSLAAFGYGPKTLARVLRLDGALRLARGGAPFATVAATAGYADQAHLARDVRALAGLPLGAVLAGA